jgi:transposase
MYLRTISRRNKDGSVVRYLQLAHNVRNPKGQAQARVVYSFGREDQLDRAALQRLVRSICRFLDSGFELEACTGGELAFIASRPLGDAYLLDYLWERLGIGATLKELLRKRRFATDVERVLFALVANRAINPTSKLAATEWATGDAVIAGLAELTEDQAYRAMDFLLQAQEEIQREVFFRVANLLNLEVDLIFFDTTSTYFETECEDDFRKYGHSKDHREDRPQVVVGLAVTRDGIPVRCWSFEGNTTDVTLVERIKDDLRDWRLGRVVMVVDRGFTSEDNLRYMQRAGGGYIAGEKLRSGAPLAEEALARPGRYREVAENLKVKEIVVGEGARAKRYILCLNPQEAERDRVQREDTLRRLETELAGLKQISGEPHRKAACELRAHKSMGRYLKQGADGRLVIDRAKVARETRLDGKFLLSTSDQTLSAEDVALGYKQLAEVERGFKDLKHTMELRPVYHRKEERIRSHVTLCFLALLLIRVAETESKMTWREIKAELGRMHLGEFSGPAGRVLQRTATTPAQQEIFRRLGIKEPPRFVEISS